MSQSGTYMQKTDQLDNRIGTTQMFLCKYDLWQGDEFSNKWCWLLAMTRLNTELGLNHKNNQRNEYYKHKNSNI